MTTTDKFIPCLVALVLALSATGLAAAQNPPGEPVIYEGIEFPDLPYASRWIEVNGAKLHYMEAGDPACKSILFLHGNPTWSYLWRNVMPHLESSGRLIALDLVGMGKSDKPDIGYTFVEHRDYLWRFIELMRLENMVLVLHDWGSALGFDYARNHPDNVAGITFMEALMMPSPPVEDMPDSGPGLIQMIRSNDGRAEILMLGQNIFVEQFLPSAILRELSEEEMNAYRAPFPSPETRKPILVWPRQIPTGGDPAGTHEIVSAYAQWLPTSDLPKLMLHGEPGMLPPPHLEMARKQYQNLEILSVGAGLHFIQEDQPDAIGIAIADWLERVVFAS